MMSELQEYQDTFPWTTGERMLEIPAVVITDSQDPHEDSVQPVNDVDTSVIPPAEDRVVESSDEAPLAADNIKKPPVDPPGTTQESADDDPEGAENKPAQAVSALGELASGTEISNSAYERKDAHSSLPPGLEVIKDGGVTIVANRNHSDQALVDKALATYRENPVWPHADHEQYAERTYHVDNPGDPALFAKATDYSRYPGVTASEGLNELILSEEINEVINSDEAQQVVQEAGFDSISFVEPLLTASPDGTNTRLTVYPWQEERSIGTALIGRETAEGGQFSDARRVADDIADDLRVLLCEKGINAKDLSFTQLRVDPDNNIKLVDAELYVKFEKPTPSFAPNQVAHRKDGQWHEGANPLPASPESPRETFAEPGAAIIARGSDSGQSPELSTEKGAGRVVVLWNAITKEGAIVNNVDARQLGHTLNDVFKRLPNLKGVGTIEHAVGHYDLVRHPATRDASLTARKSVPVTGVVDVRLDTGTGLMEVYSKAGERLYKYQPPSISGA